MPAPCPFRDSACRAASFGRVSGKPLRPGRLFSGSCPVPSRNRCGRPRCSGPAALSGRHYSANFWLYAITSLASLLFSSSLSASYLLNKPTGSRTMICAGTVEAAGRTTDFLPVPAFLFRSLCAGRGLCSVPPWPCRFPACVPASVSVPAPVPVFVPPPLFLPGLRPWPVLLLPAFPSRPQPQTGRIGLQRPSQAIPI